MVVNEVVREALLEVKGDHGERKQIAAEKDGCRLPLFDRREELVVSIDATVQVGCKEAHSHEFTVHRCELCVDSITKP
jgi:hypothetical protein